jgi:hypothetical protein
MYRELPSSPGDSGWSFLSGEGSQAYLDDPDHLGLYDVNTVANYDPEIIPLLDSPPGSAFARRGSSGKLVWTPFPGGMD